MGLITSGLAGLLWSNTALAADWAQLNPGQFGGKVASSYMVNPADANQQAAVVGRQLWVSGSGGLIWQSSSMAPSAGPVFDNVYSAHLAVGLESSFATSDDLGSSWQIHQLPTASDPTVTQLAYSRDGLYVLASLHGGRQGQAVLYLYNRQGQLLSISSPTTVSTMAVDPLNQRLCIGTNSGVSCSADDGISWQDFNISAQTLSLGKVTRLVVRDNFVGFTSLYAYYYSQDGGISWTQHLISYGSDSTAGLVIDGGNAFFGVADSGGGRPLDVREVSDDHDTDLQLGQWVNDLASGNGVLYAATNNGVWVSRGVVHGWAEISRPVIVIPGIMGSWPKYGVAGQLVLDPIEHSYDKLIATLKNAGYVPDKTLFEFPYQWRDDNEQTAKYLQGEIAYVKFICGCQKVDLVGHSMGGLVARQYIEGDDYKDDVNKLIEVGTPNEGSASSYYTWEGGEIFKEGSFIQKSENNVASALFHAEALAHRYLSLAAYVRDHIKSVGELLPTTNYITGRTYPEGYPKNAFLAKLNLPGNLAKLRAKVKLITLGNDSLPTLDTLTVDQPKSGGWPDGQVKSYTDAKGDGTVTIGSLTAFSALDTAISSEHQMLTAVGADTILHYLLDDAPSDHYLETVPNHQSLQQQVAAIAPATDSYLVATATNGADLALKDTVGKKVDGLYLQIPGAYYLAPGDSAAPTLITVPNPLSRPYQITVTLPTAGTAILGVTNINDTNADNPVTTEQAIATQTAGSVTFDYDPLTGQLTQTNSTRTSAKVIIAPGQGEGLLPLIVPVAQAIAANVTLPSVQDLAVAKSQVAAVTTVPAIVSHPATPIQAVKQLVIMAKNPAGLGVEFWLSITVPVASVLALALWKLSLRVK